MNKLKVVFLLFFPNIPTFTSTQYYPDILFEVLRVISFEVNPHIIMQNH
jgi:hypothetical protein